MNVVVCRWGREAFFDRAHRKLIFIFTRLVYFVTQLYILCYYYYYYYDLKVIHIAKHFFRIVCNLPVSNKLQQFLRDMTFIIIFIVIMAVRWILRLVKYVVANNNLLALNASFKRS